MKDKDKLMVDLRKAKDLIAEAESKTQKLQETTSTPASPSIGSTQESANEASELQTLLDKALKDKDQMEEELKKACQLQAEVEARAERIKEAARAQLAKKQTKEAPTPVPSSPQKTSSARQASPTRMPSPIRESGGAEASSSRKSATSFTVRWDEHGRAVEPNQPEDLEWEF